MPELHKADVQPVPLPRSASAPSDMPPPKPIQVRSLDRIDELDETNPFGSHLHHGGPYEAISRLITSKQKHVSPSSSMRADLMVNVIPSPI